MKYLKWLFITILILRNDLIFANGQPRPSQTALATLDVSATIVPSCSVNTTAINFGNYFLDEVRATGTISVTCTTGTEYRIALDGGNSGDDKDRYMAQGSERLNYGLYSNSQGTENWGMQSGGPQTASGSGSAQSYNVYGIIPAGQAAPVSQTPYTDTINVTVVF